ncbi:UNVERIFIED_CONTAM: Tetratricopeptide repeat protein 4 [Sesamum indicum]
MALWMEAGSEPKTNEEIVDLEAIAALKESAAIELKEKGNEYVKMGKKHYSDAIDCYTRAINQKALSNSESSILYSNRAHVNLLLGNYRRALQDAEEAIRLSPTNVKALYRAVKAALSLNLMDEAKSYCDKGLQQSPDNEELKKLAKQIDVKLSEQQQREAEVSKAVAAAKDLVSAFEDRRITFGKAMYQELTGIKKPMLDKNKILHWPVLLLYAEVMSSDIIEDFCEMDMFSESSPPLPWDTKNAYTRDAIELYYEADSGVCLSKKEILSYLLEGTAASHLEKFGVEETDAAHSSVSSGNGPKWIRVNEKRTLHDILKSPNIIIPGIPVFFVVSKKSNFYNDFKHGNWAPPQ